MRVTRKNAVPTRAAYGLAHVLCTFAAVWNVGRPTSPAVHATKAPRSFKATIGATV